MHAPGGLAAARAHLASLLVYAAEKKSSSSHSVTPALNSLSACGRGGLLGYRLKATEGAAAAVASSSAQDGVWTCLRWTAASRRPACPACRPGRRAGAPRIPACRADPRRALPALHIQGSSTSHQRPASQAAGQTSFCFCYSKAQCAPVSDAPLALCAQSASQPEAMQMLPYSAASMKCLAAAHASGAARGSSQTSYILIAAAPRFLLALARSSPARIPHKMRNE